MVFEDNVETRRKQELVFAASDRDSNDLDEIWSNTRDGGIPQSNDEWQLDLY